MTPTPIQSSPAIGDDDPLPFEFEQALADAIDAATKAFREKLNELAPTPSPASGERDAEKQITWLKSSLVAILTLCKSDTPPTYASLAEIIERALDKADSLSSTTAGGK